MTSSSGNLFHVTGHLCGEFTGHRCKLCHYNDITWASWSSRSPAIRVCARYFAQDEFIEASTWWRHQMEIFSALLAICAGNSPVTGEFPTQRPVTRSLDIYFDLRPNERLSKQWWGWWFETLSRSLWRHRNEILKNCVSGPLLWDSNGDWSPIVNNAENVSMLWHQHLSRTISQRPVGYCLL